MVGHKLIGLIIIGLFVVSSISLFSNRIPKALITLKPILLNALTKDIHLGLNPRYGRLGRIPGSLNIPFHELVD